MKRTTRLIALLCALVLLAALAGCGKNPTPTPDPTPTPEYEMIAVTMPEQQADVAGEKIIKADRAIYSLWMLTDEHNPVSYTHLDVYKRQPTAPMSPPPPISASTTCGRCRSSRIFMSPLPLTTWAAA